MKWKFLSSAIILMLTISLATACESKPKEEASKMPETTIKTDSKEIIIKAKNFEFDQQEIHIKKGDKIKLTLKNEEGIHGIEIKDLGIKIDGNNSAEFTADKKGTFEYVCSISCGEGHTKMKGKLIVE